jgi:hypothetical protein
MNEQLSGHHLDFIGGVRGCLFGPCCHVWSFLSKKTTPTLPLLHRQAKKKVYRPEIPDERAAAGGEGRQRRRVAARPWGEEALSPRGRASHSVDGGIDSVRDDVILAHSAALLLSGPAAACTNQCQVRTRRAPLLRGRVRAPYDNSILIQIFLPRPAFNDVIASRCGDDPVRQAVEASCVSPGAVAESGQVHASGLFSSGLPAPLASEAMKTNGKKSVSSLTQKGQAVKSSSD